MRANNKIFGPEYSGPFNRTHILARIFVLFLTLAATASCNVKDRSLIAGIRPMTILNADWPEYSSPVYNDGVVYAGSIRGRVMALDLETKKIVWRKKLGERIMFSPGAGNGKVFVGTEDGLIRALNASDGTVLWEYQINSPIISNIHATKDKVYFNAGDNVFYCLNTETGEWMWEYTHEVTNDMTVLGLAEATIDQGVLFTGFADGYVIALNPDHGGLIWRVKPEKSKRFEDIDAPILADSERVYVSSYANSTFALNRIDGSTIWRFDQGGVYGMAVGERLLFLSAQDKTLYGIDKANGEAKWSFMCKRKARLTRPVIVKSRLAVACSMGHVHIVDSGSGAEVETLKMPGSINSPLSLIDNRLMAFTGKGFLVALAYPK